MKRVLSLILTLCLIGGSVITNVKAVSATQVQQSLKSVISDFPAGSFFTTDGKKGSPSELTKIMRARGLNPTGYDKSYTCVGFAKYVWAKVFNHSITSEYRKEFSSGQAGNKNTWKNAMIGDLVYFYKNSDLKVHPEYPKTDSRYDPYVHAAIIWAISDSGITLYDCNQKGVNQIGLYTVSFGGRGWPKTYCRLFRSNNYDIVNNDLQQITIYFDPNGGSVSPSSKKITAESKLSNLPTPTRDGFTFKGWSLERIESGSTFNGITTIIQNGSSLSENTTLYAFWVCSGHTYEADVCTNCGAKFKYDNGFDSSAAGTYQVTASTAYVRIGPYQVKDLVKTLSKGETVQVTGSVVNSYGNTWLKTSNGYYINAEKMEMGSHTHTKDNRMVSPEHPHYVLYTCNICGEVYTDGTATLDSCKICNPKDSNNVYDGLVNLGQDAINAVKPPHTEHTKDNRIVSSAHPHYVSYTCSVCGEVYTDNSKEAVSTCEKCWGPWSKWTSKSVKASATRQVETRKVKVSDGYTEYRYGRYIDSTGKNNCWCAKYLENLSYVSGKATLQYSNWSKTRYYANGVGWTCGFCNGKHIGVDKVGADGRPWWAEYELPGGDFYWEESRTVAAQYETQYRYRDLIGG